MQTTTDIKRKRSENEIEGIEFGKKKNIATLFLSTFAVKKRKPLVLHQIENK